MCEFGSFSTSAGLPVHSLGVSPASMFLIGSTILAAPTAPVERSPVAALAPDGIVGAQPALRLRDDGSFNILQIADVHMGDLTTRANADAETLKAVGDLLAFEPKVDLAVLSGDQLHAQDIDDNATAYWDKLTGLLDSKGLPHTAILGNHDVEPQHGKESAPGAKTNRTALIAHDAALARSYSVLGPSELWPAASVFVVDVLSHDPSIERPALQLVHLDSGGGDMPQEVHAAQVAWFNRTLAARRAQWGFVPALVFVHIPLPEVVGAWEEQRCFGDKDEDIGPTDTNAGLFDAIQAAPEVRAVFSGHQHCNDFCCRFGAERAVSLCYGRHSGAGGYPCEGALEMWGSRVVEVSTLSNGSLAFSTRVRLVDGRTVAKGEL